MQALTYSLLNPNDTDLPLLILGTPLGTSAAVWASVGYRLLNDYQVAVTELPGHGQDGVNAPVDGRNSELTIDAIAQRTVQVANELGRDSFVYAGCSISGGVAQHLALAHSDRVRRVAALCTGVKFGEPDMWFERAQTAVQDGTRSLIPDTADRWFAAGFLEDDLAAGHMVLEQLAATNDQAYAACCMALSRFDLSARISEIETPVLYVAGAQDYGNSPEAMQELANTVKNGSFAVIPDAAHIVMAEHPELVAEKLLEFFSADA